MKESVRQLIIGLTTYVVLFALLIVGSFLDLKIAQAVSIPGNFFSVITKAVGKMPAFLIMAASCAILVRCAQNKECNIVLKRFFIVLYACLGLVSAMFGFLDCVALIFKKPAQQYFVSLLCAGLVYVLFMADISKFCKQEFERYKKWAFSVCIIVGIVAVVTYSMKFICQRATLIDILENGATFSPWYHITKFSGGWAMPDNRTALAFTGWILLTLTKIHPRMAGKELLFDFANIAFILLIMIGNLISGVYFVSDIAIGGLIGFTITLVVKLLAFGSDGDRIALSERNILNKL